MFKEIGQKTFEQFFRNHLKIETYSKSIESLYSDRLKSKIDYQPSYQRNYVWDDNKATYFIESILLGTEIPPLIFFDNNSKIEVIDGRQRFETILRFIDNKFALNAKGLHVLSQLKTNTYKDLNKNDRAIVDKFEEAKLRIIVFKLVNNPVLDQYLEDRIKKEIFSRYNSGITPLKNPEIDNAIYDKNALSIIFKKKLENDIELVKVIYSTFFKKRELSINHLRIEAIMTFIRRNLALSRAPIGYYARSSRRIDLLAKLYERLSDEIKGDEDSLFNSFIHKIRFIEKIKSESEFKKLKSNRFALECFLWALIILESENIEVNYDTVLANEIIYFIDSNIDSYTERDSNYTREVIMRYSKTAEFIEKFYNLNTIIYVSPDDSKRAELRVLLKPNDTATKLEELETLRLNKPEPSRISIDDLTRLVKKGKFLVRPSYQRQEVINRAKASSIIESILLDITLPAIFIFKRADGISEVIDGQQRLLTILGYIGSEYVNEKGELKTSINHKFSLEKLGILKDELDGKKFEELDQEQRDKIYDFNLYIVEIDHTKNIAFDPIDLFIRLNSKPFPIRENSFEMWNSWVDLDIINDIKQTKAIQKDWFYVKQTNTPTYRDRMETEELITSLIYLEYSLLTKDTRKFINIYQTKNRLNARIGDKNLISKLLLDSTKNHNIKKKDFDIASKNFKSFLKNLKYILLDHDKSNSDTSSLVKLELNNLFNSDKKRKNYSRSMQDFYFIWYLINDVNLEKIKAHTLEMRTEITYIFYYLKNISTEDWKENKGLLNFNEFVLTFKNKYKETTIETI